VSTLGAKIIMSFLGRLSGTDLQSFAFSRRELSGKLLAIGAALLLPQSQSLSFSPELKRRSQIFSFTEAPEPEFWFGDRVSFCWNDEDTEQPYSETGEVIGVVWNPRENYWEYSVTWLSSTVYPSSNYPLYDGNFLTGGELCKL
jgi:hypothetical protein